MEYIIYTLHTPTCSTDADAPQQKNFLKKKVVPVLKNVRSAFMP